jgi:hypothetical protein
MQHRLYGLLFLFGFAAIISGLTVAACYGWLRTIHSPLRLYQKKMLYFVALTMAACPVLTPLWMACAYWMRPAKESGVCAIA